MNDRKYNSYEPAVDSGSVVFLLFSFRKNGKEKKKKKIKRKNKYICIKEIKDKTAVVICRGNFPIQLRESYMFVDTMGSVYVKNIYSTYFSEIGYLLNLYIYWSYGRFCCMYVLHVLSLSILSGIRNHISANKVLAIFHFL